MKNGGKRPGAGRKKGSLKPENKLKLLQESMAREHMVKFFLSHWKEIEETMYKVAMGNIRVEKNGVIYQKEPDPKMLQTLSETVIGRPKQEIAGAIDLPQLDKLATDIKSILEKKK